MRVRPEIARQSRGSPTSHGRSLTRRVVVITRWPATGSDGVKLRSGHAPHNDRGPCSYKPFAGLLIRVPYPRSVIGSTGGEERIPQSPASSSGSRQGGRRPGRSGGIQEGRSQHPSGHGRARDGGIGSAMADPTRPTRGTVQRWAPTSGAPSYQPSGVVYRPRRPTATPLYPVVQHHLETLLASREEADPTGWGVPGWVESDFRGYLRCGILAFGFARVRCDDCGQERLLAFSCKGRGVCPSCNARRMAEVAAHLTDHVLPHLPIRQWVLSLPKRLRPFLHGSPEVASAVLGTFLRALRPTLRRASPTAPRGSEIAAISFPQRFGSFPEPALPFPRPRGRWGPERGRDPGLRRRAVSRSHRARTGALGGARTHPADATAPCVS